MIRKKAIIDVDHMSARSFDNTMTLAEEIGYPVISGHTGFIEIAAGPKRHEGNKTLTDVQRIRNVGGLVAPILQQGSISEATAFAGGRWTARNQCSHSIETFAQAYLYAITQMGMGPVPIGSDFNAPPPPGVLGPQFGAQGCFGGGTPPPEESRLRYPFNSLYSGRDIFKSVIGDKEFDFNNDGLAHVGMLPDFIASLQQVIRVTPSQDPREPFRPLFNSAEGYIRMWERIEARRIHVYVDLAFPCTTCGDGTSENPYNDLFQAIRNAEDGSILMLRPGRYEVPRSQTLGKALKFTRWGEAGIVQWIRPPG
jgi:hypothetical protein